MALSNSTNFTVTRDDIIKRALRIVSAIGQGETPDTAAYTEAALALNLIAKEFQADGMQLWKRLTSTPVTLVAGTASYTIGVSSTIAQTAPLKVLDAWMRTTASSTDSPMTLLTKADYDIYGNKTSQGTPSQVHYEPPGPNVTELEGTFTFYPVPDANTVATQTFVFEGVYPLMDFDTSTDNPDFPGFYYNALIWALADQLSTEYGVPLSERGFIQNKADKHYQKAKGFDVEEGSLYLQPTPDWGDGYGS